MKFKYYACSYCSIHREYSLNTQGHIELGSYKDQILGSWRVALLVWFPWWTVWIEPIVLGLYCFMVCLGNILGKYLVSQLLVMLDVSPTPMAFHLRSCL
jgi:hypothetical protein